MEKSPLSISFCKINFPKILVRKTRLCLYKCSPVMKVYELGLNLRWIKLDFGVSSFFIWFGGILGSASRAEFPISLSNHAGFTPWLLYSSTHHSLEGFIQLALVELKMLDFGDPTRTGISILTSAADCSGSHHYITTWVFVCAMPGRGSEISFKTLYCITHNYILTCRFKNCCWSC